MTKQNKLKKLYNVIIEYRGRFDANTKKWIYPPNLNAISRLRKWLRELSIEEYKAIKEVNEFKSFEEFRNWIKAI